MSPADRLTRPVAMRERDTPDSREATIMSAIGGLVASEWFSDKRQLRHEGLM